MYILGRYDEIGDLFDRAIKLGDIDCAPINKILALSAIGNLHGTKAAFDEALILNRSYVVAYIKAFTTELGYNPFPWTIGIDFGESAIDVERDKTISIMVPIIWTTIWRK